MDIDSLKNTWKSDSGGKTPEVDLKLHTDHRSTIDMIRLNMKSEFIVSLFFLPYNLVPTFIGNVSSEVKITAYIVSGLYLLILLYLFLRLNYRYKKLKNRNVNTNYELFNLKTEVLVLKEIFYTYYVTCIPIIFISEILKSGMRYDKTMDYLTLVTTVLTLFLSLFIIIKYWFKIMYGKYIDSIVTTVDELNDIKSKSLQSYGNSYFEKMQVYFISKWGIVGNIINIFLWIVFMSVVIAIVIVLIYLIILLLLSGGSLEEIKMLIKN